MQIFFKEEKKKATSMSDNSQWVPRLYFGEWILPLTFHTVYLHATKAPMEQTECSPLVPHP